MTQRTIGVLGGLGPWATLDLFEKLLRLTPAAVDQDHLRIIIDNNPKIPDRSPAILGAGEDPTPALVATARNLERAGADFIIIPCNTAHAFVEAIRASVAIPVLNIMDEVAAAAAAEMPPLRRAGVLATRAAVAARLYHHSFARVGVDVLSPDSAGQDVVNEAIYGVKAGRMGPDVTRRLVGVCEGLILDGAQVLVLGCTELPFVLQPGDVEVPLLDSTLVLARAALREATQPTQPTQPTHLTQPTQLPAARSEHAG